MGVKTFEEYEEQKSIQLTSDHDKQVRADERKKVCEAIIEEYNLTHKPIVGEFGDTNHGYIMVNAKHLYNLLLEIEKGENDGSVGD